MSTSTADKCRTDQTKSPKVLVRAYGDQPVPFRAVGAHGSVVEVAGKGGARIGIPLTEVFQFNDDTFSSLFAAYQDGGQADLQALWSQATLFNSNERNDG